jgi:hypothetical protein
VGTVGDDDEVGLDLSAVVQDSEAVRIARRVLASGEVVAEAGRDSRTRRAPKRVSTAPEWISASRVASVRPRAASPGGVEGATRVTV